MSDIGSAIGEFGGAVQDIFGAVGSSQAASAYDTAAKIASQNEALTQRSTAIQAQQQGIATFKALGSETADVAGAGFTQGGSAGDLLRSSAQQAALSKQLIVNQGDITAQGYAQQAAAYEGQKEAAQTQSKGQGAGGILGILSTVATVASLF